MTVLLFCCALLPPTAAALCARPGVDGDVSRSGVVNRWFPGPDGVVLEAGSRRIPLAPPRPAGGLAAGDLALLIQMQGARINDSNSLSYGDATRSGSAAGWTRMNAGHYELVVVEAVAADAIRVRGAGDGGGLIHRYVNREPAAAGDPGRARWQLVRVPQYENLVLDGDVRALPWNGFSGGVLALDVRDTLDLNGHALDAGGSGFRGGAPLTLLGALGDPGDYRYRAPTADELEVRYGHHAAKGEGLAGSPRYLVFQGEIRDTRPEVDRPGLSDGYPHGSMARGAPANAGGGGNSLTLDNSKGSGGGGGGGGRPGQPGQDSMGDTRGGRGGAALAANLNLLVPGGGGGAGTRPRGEGLAGAGGAGGGVVLVTAGRVRGPGALSVAGQDAEPGSHAGGGGGGGGTLALLAPFAVMGDVSVLTAGGAGGSAPAPGGSGGAGRLLYGGGMEPLTPEGTAVNDRLTEAHLYGASPGWKCKPSATLIAGLVFQDNGIGGGEPHDGWLQSGEHGLEGWPVRVLNQQGRVLAETLTNRSGRYALKVGRDHAGSELTLRVEVPEQWHVVAASEDQLPIAPMLYQGQGNWRFTARSEVQYDNLRLAVVRGPTLREPDERSISAGTTQFFSFRYTAHTPSRVRFRYSGNLAAGADWEHAFFLDPDCDRASEYVDRTLTRWVPARPSEPVCVRVRVEVPKSAASGALDIDLQAETDIGETPLELRLPVRKTGIRITLTGDE